MIMDGGVRAGRNPGSGWAAQAPGNSSCQLHADLAPQGNVTASNAGQNGRDHGLAPYGRPLPRIRLARNRVVISAEGRPRYSRTNFRDHGPRCSRPVGLAPRRGWRAPGGFPAGVAALGPPGGLAAEPVRVAALGPPGWAGGAAGLAGGG